MRIKHVSLFVMLVGCNAVFGIDEATVRPSSSEDPNLQQNGNPNEQPNQTQGPQGGSSGGANGSVTVPDPPGFNAIVPADCTLGPRVIASKGEAMFGPTLAVAGRKWAVAWKSEKNVRFNVVGETGDALLATDARVFELDGELENTPRMIDVGGGSELAIAVGQRDDDGGAHPAVQKIETSGVRGDRVGRPMLPYARKKPPRIGAIAPNHKGYFAIAFVDDDNDYSYAGARTASFNIGMNGFEHKIYSPVLGTAIGYAPGSSKYGSLFVLGSGRAELDVLDQYGNGLGDGPFYLEGADVYIDTTHGPDMISAAGVNTRLAIAWTTGSSIAMTLMSLYDGKHTTAVVVSDEDNKVSQKSRPQVLYDAAAKTIGVSWIESERLMFRRFASSGSSGSSVDLTPVDTKPAVLDVVDSKNSYGFAQGTTTKEWSFALLHPTNRHQIVRRLSCTM
jgi:hypothetical protein